MSPRLRNVFDAVTVPVAARRSSREQPEAHTVEACVHGSSASSSAGGNRRTDKRVAVGAAARKQPAREWHDSFDQTEKNGRSGRAARDLESTANRPQPRDAAGSRRPRSAQPDCVRQADGGRVEIASGSGSASRSAWIHSTSVDLRRARSGIAGESMPTTSLARRGVGKARSPVPRRHRRSARPDRAAAAAQRSSGVINRFIAS